MERYIDAMEREKKEKKSQQKEGGKTLKVRQCQFFSFIPSGKVT